MAAPIWIHCPDGVKVVDAGMKNYDDIRDL